MACGATLKRTLEFDPLHSPSQAIPPIKRRRCMPLTMSQAPPPTKFHHLSPSPFAEVTPQMTKEEITARIGSELKRMQKRRQLYYPTSHSPPLSTCSSLGRQSPPISLEALTSATATSRDFPSLPSHSASEIATSRQKEVPLFTFRQVSMICERLVKEHEDNLRENYDKVLNNKLSEQYEAFLKFNHDQLQKRFGNAPMSYVS